MAPPTRMETKVEQRTVLHFLVREGKKPIDCWRQMRTVFGDDTMSKTRIRVWHKRFLAGCDSFKDDKHTRRPRSGHSNHNIQKVQAALRTDQRMTVRGLAAETNISKSSVHGILKKDLRLSKVAAKLVPKELTPRQKAFRKRLCEENLAAMRVNPDLMDLVVTGDESWVSVMEMETKQGSSAWIPRGSRSDRLTKACQQRNACKSMLTVFFDKQGVVLSEFLAPGTTVDTDQYLEVLQRLRENIRRKRPNLWGNVRRGEPCPFLLHQDNASSHTSSRTLAYFGENSIDLLAHPPNSLNLAPCDYFLFPKLKSALRGVRHANLDAMKAAVFRVLRSIPQVEFEKALMSLPIRWMKCVSADGEYFEGRHMPYDPEDHGLEIVFGEESEEED